MKPEKRTPIPAVTENIPAMEIKNSDVSIHQLVHFKYQHHYNKGHRFVL